MTFRNVAHLGKIVATLDVLSGGRAVCGLGAGWFEAEHAAYGIPFPPARERLDLLEDALRLLPLLWGKGAPAFEGRRISVPEALCYPRPLQEHVPILVGGSGQRRTLRLVAQYADACNLQGEPDAVRAALAVLHRHCADVGRDPAEIEVTHLSTIRIGSRRPRRRGGGVCRSSRGLSRTTCCGSRRCAAPGSPTSSSRWTTSGSPARSSVTASSSRRQEEHRVTELVPQVPRSARPR